MTTFAEIERVRERVDGLAWENSQHGASECVCSHERDDHDSEGVCQIRRCKCETFNHERSE